MSYEFILSISIGHSSKMLRLLPTRANLEEAIKMVNWDIPKTVPELLVVRKESDYPDKVVCAVTRQHIFNPMAAHVQPKPLEFINRLDHKEKFTSKAGLNPSGAIADWILAKIQDV